MPSLLGFGLQRKPAFGRIQTVPSSADLHRAGDTRVPVLATSLWFFVFRIPLACFLTRDHVDPGVLGQWPGWNLGVRGACWAMFADLQVRGLFFMWRFANRLLQRMRV